MTSTVLANLEKTSADRLDYDIDYSKWLTEGDLIVSAMAEISDASSVSFIIDTIEVAEQMARVWISSGVNGDISEVAVFATTQAGRIKEARFSLLIKDD